MIACCGIEFVEIEAEIAIEIYLLERIANVRESFKWLIVVQLLSDFRGAELALSHIKLILI